MTFAPAHTRAGSVRGWSALAAALALAAGCDGNARKDPTAPVSQRVAEVSVRIDMPNSGAPAVSVLAFRADVTEISAADVLGVVDPLTAPAPETTCELRDVSGTARNLRAAGGSVDLQELGGVAVTLDAAAAIKPAPRVYPPLGEVVGGVIAEAGPMDIDSVPSALSVDVPGADDKPVTANLSVAGVPRVFDQNQAPLTNTSHLDAAGNLVLLVAGPAKTFLEIRPYGAPVALACPAGAGGWVVVPHAMLARLVASAGGVPVAFEAVWRDSRVLIADGQPTRVSVETRSSAVVELHP